MSSWRGWDEVVLALTLREEFQNLLRPQHEAGDGTDEEELSQRNRDRVEDAVYRFRVDHDDVQNVANEPARQPLIFDSKSHALFPPNGNLHHLCCRIVCRLPVNPVNDERS